MYKFLFHYGKLTIVVKYITLLQEGDRFQIW